jgi:hypothetical protein
VDTFLTLVIALGGIATGVGAIWTAMLARRQLDEQRQFLLEQTQIARRQAQLTEESLAEQNERSSLNLEVDLLFRMADHLESPHFLSRRRSAAKHAIDNYLADDMPEMPRLNRATRDVANFFEQLGYLQRLGALQAESVWHRFGIITREYWPLFEPAI